jgi:hypothetical protein
MKKLKFILILYISFILINQIVPGSTDWSAEKLNNELQEYNPRQSRESEIVNLIDFVANNLQLADRMRKTMDRKIKDLKEKLREVELMDKNMPEPKFINNLKKFKFY